MRTERIDEPHQGQGGSAVGSPGSRLRGLLVFATVAPADSTGGAGGNPSTDKLAEVEQRGTLILSTDPAYPPQSFKLQKAVRAAKTKCAANHGSRARAM